MAEKETVYYLETVTGHVQRVPASKLEEWKAAQEKAKAEMATGEYQKKRKAAEEKMLAAL